MILNAHVAKLAQHMSDLSFSYVILQLESAQAEGLDNFDLDVSKIDDDMRFDLQNALIVMEYDVDFLEGEQILNVSMP